MATWPERARYRLDRFMARGGISLFISLVLIFFGLLVLFTLLRALVYLGAGDTSPFSREIYITFLELTDPSGMVQDQDRSVGIQIIAIVAGITGVVIFSMLIAFITTSLDQRLHQLKKGHSKVVESGHTLILGWNDRIIEILRELVIANENEKNPAVVILAEQEKEEMDDFLHLNLRKTKNTRIVTRSGPISSLVNLEIASVATCESVIILAKASDASTDEEKAASDVRVIKTILGVMASKPPDTELNVVAELFESRNREIAESISPEEVSTLDADHVLAKLLVQTSRSTGLSLVYSEMFSFDGAEVYYYEASWPRDMTFGQVQYHFPDGIPLGIRRDGEVEIHPPAEQTMLPGDEVLILAEDDSTIYFKKKPVAIPRDLPLKESRLDKKVEADLIIGWNPKGPLLIREYNDYVLRGSSVRVVMQNPPESAINTIRQLDSELPNLSVTLSALDPMESDALERIEPWNYQNIIVLSQGKENSDPETVDSKSIVILLLIRKLFEKHEKSMEGIKLISEVMDSKNQELIAHSGVNDFIISNRFISMLMAQMSETANIQQVYEKLFAEEGSEIYVKPAHLYFESVPDDLTFADLMGIAQKRGEICLGVKIKAEEKSSAKNYGVRLNPKKKQVFSLTEQDGLIVVSDDET